MEKKSLNALVLALVGDPELADRWWYTPNKAFDMSRPIDVDTRTVRDYLMQHCFAGGGS
jgi:hypothetical protein